MFDTVGANLHVRSFMPLLSYPRCSRLHVYCKEMSFTRFDAMMITMLYAVFCAWGNRMHGTENLTVYRVKEEQEDNNHIKRTREYRHRQLC